MSTINIDSTNSEGSNVRVQAQYYATADSNSYTDAVDPSNMKVFISNNVNYNDPLLIPYYTNAGNVYNTVGPYPLSYLTWSTSDANGNPCVPPYDVKNIPGQWMNDRTKAFFAAFAPGVNNGYGFVEEETITSDPGTVTPGIADATVADQMARWNQNMWGDPAYPSSENDILNSAYIFGDYNPLTIPGLNTEDGEGITKFTDLTEDFSQTAHISALDGKAIGSLIWDDAAMASYDPAASLQAAWDQYNSIVSVISTLPGSANSYKLEQNYPNPFNPSTTIQFSVTSAGNVELAVYNILGQRVRTLLNSETAAGSYKVQFDGKDDSGLILSSGVYFYKINTGNFVQTKKMVFLK
jgi:hypothetical protein